MWRYKTLFFDLEVVSTIEDAEDRVPFDPPKPGKVPANWKDKEKIAAKQLEIVNKHARDMEAYEAKRADEVAKVRQSGALTWNESQICLISWAVNDGPVELLSVYSDAAEFRALRDFGKVIRAADPDIITAFNGAGYDFPMMRYRALSHGMPALAEVFTELQFGVARQLGYYRNGPTLLDPRAHGLTPGKWTGLKGSGSLDSCAAFFGIDRSANPGKGSEVQTWYDAGDHESIRAHGEDDIHVYRQVWKRIVPWSTGE